MPLLGTVSGRKWALVGPWYFDPSFIKNSLVYALSNRLGRWAPATQAVEVFFHAGGDLGAADYAGIYVLTERIEVDPQRVNIAPLTAADVTGGYIIKLDSPDSDEFSWTTARDVPGGVGAVVVASAKAADLSLEQRDYVQTYIQRMEDTLVANFDRGFATRTYLDFIDRASWVDLHLINVLASNFDGLERSTYFSKDRGSKLVAGPVWDYDRSFGAATYYATTPPDAWMVQGGVNFWQTGWWGYLAHDPEFMQDWIDRWQSLRQDVLATSSLVGLADGLFAAIGPEAAARDAARWPLTIPDYAPGVTGDVQSLKAWMIRRVAWIDGQFVPPPTVVRGDTDLTFRPGPGAQLIYTLDGTDPRSLGGRMAPNALLADGPLSVPASANIHVRCYRADREGVFPGSPWSSAVGGARSSPLSPAARIVNISARAPVGTGENILIVGVVVGDTVQKSYLARGVGPTLATFGAANVLPDPALSIRGADGVELCRNSGWLSGSDAGLLVNTARSVGAFALAGSGADSAVVAQLGAGPSTLGLSSASGKSGLGLAELYELGTNGRITNLSARASLQTGDDLLVGGFVLQGPAFTRILARALGPALQAFGVGHALADLILTVYAGQTAVASNKAWSAESGGAAVSAASAAVGAFPLPAGSHDAALLLTLPAGTYTVEVKTKAGTAGVTLLELYAVP